MVNKTKIKKTAKKFAKLIGVLTLSISMVILTNINFPGLSRNEAYGGKCCSVVSISNFSDLVSLIMEKVASAITSTIVSEITSLKQFIDALSQTPGALKDEMISNTLNNLENLYNQVYSQYVGNIESYSTRSNWMKIVLSEQNTTVPPLVSPSGALIGDVVNYGVFIRGDMALVYDLLNSVISREKEMEPYLKDFVEHLKLRTREIESAKVSLTQEVANLGATAKKFEELNKKFDALMRKVDETQKSGNYKEEQAVKDLLKIQMLQTGLLAELLRNQINQELTYSAYQNQQLVKERDELIKDLLTLQVKTKGNWTFSPKQ